MGGPCSFPGVVRQHTVAGGATMHGGANTRPGGKAAIAKRQEFGGMPAQSPCSQSVPRAHSQRLGFPLDPTPF